MCHRARGRERNARLYDRLDAGEVDSATYKQQSERFRLERAQALAELARASAEIDDRVLVTGQRVLNLAKNAKALWNGRSDAEKRDLLTQAVCNPRLDGRTARYDLGTSVAILADVRRDGEWRPHVDDFVTALGEMVARAA